VGFEWFQRCLSFVDLSWATVLAIPRALITRPREVLRQFDRVAWGGGPIAAVAGLSIGLVTWMQLRRLLLIYGAEGRLPSVMAAAVLLETGPILASLLVAGRMGAGLGAELGSMAASEEIDAREVLGAPTIGSLIAPRAVACMLAVPLLTVVLDLAALMGGLIAEGIGGNSPLLLFQTHYFDFIRLADVGPSTCKTAVFGLIVALVSCDAGCHTGRSTEEIGQAATQGVVRSMVATFLVNVLLVLILRAVRF